MQHSRKACTIYTGKKHTVHVCVILASKHKSETKTTLQSSTCTYIFSRTEYELLYILQVNEKFESGIYGWHKKKADKIGMDVRIIE